MSILTERKIRATMAELAILRGETLTDIQRADASWLDHIRRKQITGEVLADLPKDIYCQMASQPRSNVDDHAKSFGIPLSGRSVDLFAVIKAFHELIAKNKKALFAGEESNNLKDEKVKFEVASIRRKSELLNLQLKERKRELVNRDEVLEKLSWISKRLRSLGDRIGKTFGPEAQLAVNEFLEEMAIEAEGGKLRIEGPK